MECDTYQPRRNLLVYEMDCYCFELWMTLGGLWFTKLDCHLWNFSIHFNDSFYKTNWRQNMKTTRNKKPRFLKHFWMKNKIFFAWSQTISKISNDHGRWMFRVYKLPIERIGSILRDKHLILWDFSIRKWETRRHWCLEIFFGVIFQLCCSCLL